MGLGAQTIRLERQVDDRTNALMDGLIRNRTQVLCSLTACSSDTADMRVENLIRLFRATNLFGQEYQALTSGLREDSRLPQDTVSRMLAFQDYVQAMNKAERVSKELKQLIDFFDLQLRMLDESLESNKAEQSKFKNLEETTATPESIEVAGEKLLRRITKETNLPLQSSAPITQDEVKTWRAQLEGRIASVEGFLHRIRSLKTKLPDILSLRKELSHATARIETGNKALKNIEREIADRKKALDAAETKRSETLATEKNFNVSLENLQWLLGTGEEFRV